VEWWAVYAVVLVVMALMLWPLMRLRLKDRRRPRGRHGQAIDRRIFRRYLERNACGGR
jgi:hypothetical protein